MTNLIRRTNPALLCLSLLATVPLASANHTVADHLQVAGAGVLPECLSLDPPSWCTYCMVDPNQAFRNTVPWLVGCVFPDA